MEQAKTASECAERTEKMDLYLRERHGSHEPFPRVPNLGLPVTEIERSRRQAPPPADGEGGDGSSGSRRDRPGTSTKKHPPRRPEPAGETRRPKELNPKRTQRKEAKRAGTLRRAARLKEAAGARTCCRERRRGRGKRRGGGGRWGGGATEIYFREEGRGGWPRHARGPPVGARNFQKRQPTSGCGRPGLPGPTCSGSRALSFCGFATFLLGALSPLSAHRLRYTSVFFYQLKKSVFFS